MPYCEDSESRILGGVAPASKPTAAELMDLIAARAPMLIAAGITSISIEGLSCTLAKPPVAASPLEPAKPRAKQHVDPFSDPSTYPGGRVPGFTREEDRSPE